MSHSYVRCLMHGVFSTKGRQPWIVNTLQQRLYPYMNGIAQKNDMTLLAINGTTNHVHLLGSG